MHGCMATNVLARQWSGLGVVYRRVECSVGLWCKLVAKGWPETYFYIQCKLQCTLVH